MRTIRIGLLVSVGLLGAVPACGGGGEELTCELLADPTNCWAEVAAAMKACLPAVATPPTLAADRGSCSYADGTRIVFETPLPATTDDLERLGFSIEVAGATCATFVDTFMNRIEVTAGELGVVSELHPGGDFHVHCDGGPSYETDFSTLFECAPSYPPTDGFEVTPTSVAFTIVSVVTPGELFRCIP